MRKVPVKIASRDLPTRLQQHPNCRHVRRVVEGGHVAVPTRVYDRASGQQQSMRWLEELLFVVVVECVCGGVEGSLIFPRAPLTHKNPRTKIKTQRARPYKRPSNHGHVWKQNAEPRIFHTHSRRLVY